jgi:hypothetical protein
MQTECVGASVSFKGRPHDAQQGSAIFSSQTLCQHLSQTEQSRNRATLSPQMKQQSG